MQQILNEVRQATVFPYMIYEEAMSGQAYPLMAYKEWRDALGAFLTKNGYKCEFLPPDPLDEWVARVTPRLAAKQFN